MTKRAPPAPAPNEHNNGRTGWPVTAAASGVAATTRPPECAASALNGVQRRVRFCRAHLSSTKAPGTHWPSPQECALHGVALCEKSIGSEGTHTH